MILQSLSKAIREQNWFAVALEFVIVIAGVVIGFQINAWNEERAANAAAEQAVTRLRSESEAVVEFWIESVADAVENDFNRVALLRALEVGQVEQGLEAEVYDGINGLYHYGAFTPPRNVFDELMASGGLRLISDPDASAAVSEYSEQLTFITGMLDQFRTGVSDGISALDGRIFSQFDLSSSTLRRYEYDIELLSQDREFISGIVDGVRNQRVFLFFRLGTLRTAFEMCEALSAAKGERCATAEAGRSQHDAAWAYVNEMREAP